MSTQHVATVLTACGIETQQIYNIRFPEQIVATVLTACGIETEISTSFTQINLVATVLTACGIETH